LGFSLSFPRLIGADESSKFATVGWMGGFWNDGRLYHVTYPATTQTSTNKAWKVIVNTIKQGQLKGQRV
jgi:hypothetical protein